MGTNKIVILGVAILAVIVIVAGINSFNRPSKAEVASVPGQQNQSTEKDARDAPNIPADIPIVADGDTVAETLREVQSRYDRALKDNTALEERIEQLEREANKKRRAGTSADKPTELDPRVAKAIESMSGLQNQVSDLTDQIFVRDRKKTAVGNGYTVTGDDLGWGDKDGMPRGKGISSVVPSSTLPGYVAVQPMTRNELELDLSERLNGINKSTLSTSNSGLVNTVKTTAEPSKPFYTIPARSTLFDAVAMTAIVGTVPISGRIQDPFPVKIIVGDNNLATNGLRIPGLEGIIFEGVARGNWSLSCASIALTAATFTFQDGRVQHLVFDPSSKSSGGGASKQSTSSPFSEGEASRAIGYVSNPQGVPCIPGARVSDVYKEMGIVGLLGAGASYFDAKAAAETTSSTNALGGGTTSVTGDREAFINNQTYSDSIQTVLDFYQKHTRDSVEAIYVPPQAPVVLNITQDLRVDYDPGNRMLVYRNTAERAQRLD